MCSARSLTLALLATGFVMAVPAPAATTLLVHGHIYTANPKSPWAEAIALDGERIATVGTDAAVLKQRRSDTRVIDLKGRTVIPGIIDAHMHMLFGSIERRGFSLSNPERSLTPAHPDEFVAAIRAFAASHPAERIVIGRADFSSQPPYAPTHALLDRAVSDRPLIVHNSTEHSLWVNAKALELAGITDEPVADPEEERNIIRDAMGHPSGVLLEAAMELVERAVMKSYSREEKLAILRDGSQYLNQLGITSVVNATGDLDEIELYGTLRDRGELTVRTRTAFGAVAVPHRLTPKLLADLDAARTRFHDDWVSANLVKFFADGSTGMIPPLVYRRGDFRALVEEFDRRGYQIMTHAQRGDSVHMILDAYDHAAAVNGPRDRRFRIEHAFVVTDEDAASIARLKVNIGAQPSFCCSSLGTNFDPADPTPSDRWHTLASRGVTLAFSSDWPCTWPPNPFVGMQQAVTRQEWHSDDTGPIETEPFDGAAQGGARPTGRTYVPEERISIRDAVDAYTRGSAYASFADTRTGTLEPGKLADLVVLSQDVFTVDPLAISATRPELTIVGGRIVWDAAASAPTTP